MRVVIQRVSEASVTVEKSVVGKINQGLLILLGIETEDDQTDLEWLCNKIIKLRVFEDTNQNMNLSIIDVEGQTLVVSQFTLHASIKKGTRPSFIKAARPEQAEPLYEGFCHRLEELTGKPTEMGKFGTMMAVQLINDGPVTILIDSKNRD
jgi:D-tyrosyl-tRNA(Tyr) deacylase